MQEVARGVSIWLGIFLSDRLSGGSRNRIHNFTVRSELRFEHSPVTLADYGLTNVKHFFTIVDSPNVDF